MISEKTVVAVVVENSKNIFNKAVAAVVVEEITEEAVAVVTAVEAAVVAESLKRDIDHSCSKLFRRLIRKVLVNLFYFPVLCGTSLVN